MSTRGQVKTFGGLLDVRGILSMCNRHYASVNERDSGAIIRTYRSELSAHGALYGTRQSCSECGSWRTHRH